MKILLADDHDIVRTGYRLLLSQSDGIKHIIEANSGEQAYEVYQQERPDVVIMDISLPGISGLTCTHKILAHDPQARILIFSIHDEPTYVSRALDAGARGYISKSSATNILVQAVQDVAAGKLFFDKEMLSADPKEGQVCANQLSELSPREFDIFHLVAKGHTVQQIADYLCLSTKTVANYCTAIKSKLNVKTSAELARLAYLHGVISTDKD